ncbi:hypothetical protein [Streptomyces sp. WAC 04229]|uniref:hypothetical protein n=1 Tax=Streptomyces sp. WAC 04229 TaxID=2203206 RepID=UPI003D752442
MDAGVAAVLGAAIGGLAAFGTSWFGFRVARLQIKSSESQAERQRRFESLRERREPRSQAYADLLDVAQEVLDLLRAKSRDELYGRIDDLNNSVRKQRAVVALAGPESVARAAAVLAQSVVELRNNLLHMHPKALSGFSSVEVALESFTRAARAALEDDGNPEPAVRL